LKADGSDALGGGSLNLTHTLFLHRADLLLIRQKLLAHRP